MKLKHLFTTLFFLCCTLAITAQTDSTFYIKGSMGRLAAHLQLPELKAGEKCPVVILCHGFIGNMDNPLFDTISANLTKQA